MINNLILSYKYIFVLKLYVFNHTFVYRLQEIRALKMFENADC